MQILTGYKSAVSALAFAPVRNQLVSAAGKGTVVSLWDLATGTRSYLRGHRGPPGILQFSPSGKYLATSCVKDGWEILIRAETADGGYVLKKQLQGRRIAWLTEPVLVVASLLGVQFRNVETGARPYPACNIPGEYDTLIFQMAASPDGRTLAVAVRDQIAKKNTLRLIRPRETPVRGPALKLGAYPGALAFNPDGATIAVGINQWIQRIDVASGEGLASLTDHEQTVTGLAFLPDGRLLSCSLDGTTRLWQGERCLEVHDWGLGPLTALAVARDGMRAAVGSESGEILLRDLD